MALVLDTLCCGERFQAGRSRVVLWTRRRPRMVSSLRAAKVAVIAGVRSSSLRPLCDVAVNRTAVRSSWGAPDGNDNQHAEHQHAEEEYAFGSPTCRNLPFLFHEV